ncbi:ABC transporter ATP-binding protein [Nocardia caishijiensis]|uniref:Osmoprotectant transport system ATP-binding protein n=1 Tax=Nocardia caishijiensis TaxID=184756 RepID=A0ABQ6YPF8_9NOCA|nr:ATP-binding cassette domain-containing protein [Nocardia caishijiensis]KAF0847679.1 osmoprotectant transport system ATP-binding protein [Nocardia caishijiensis]
MTDTSTAETGAATAVSGVEIVLDRVTKRYSEQPDPAVEEVSMTIPAGEIVVLVGPSGCGKTTTMRMINRLIEPTSGTITIGGRDALAIDADELRRGIGYSIQQAGLFPHMTVAKNIATVPGLLGWDRRRVATRTDEMLALVGLAPDTYRDRYPRQLSGGQQQRVGVARALAADPPVLLMDEPFGAVDPITRALLQDELLRLQGDLGKTIVFVTHDFGEAVKLGDRIAVLGDRSRILQYDTPAAILAAPADDTVAGFVGATATIDRLGLAILADLDLDQGVAVTDDTDPASLTTALHEANRSWAVVLDPHRRPVRRVTRDELAQADSLTTAGTPIGATLPAAATLQDALAALLTERTASAIVLDATGGYAGIVTVDTLIDHLATSTKATA